MLTGKFPLLTEFSEALSTRGILLVALCLLLTLQTTEAVDGKHVNAYVVTTQWRLGGASWAPRPDCCDCLAGWAGNIELVTVRNGSVARVDTVWKRSQGYGQYPAFDAEANQIAFYRWGKATQATTGGCATVNGGTNYLTVMNRDGSNPRDLVALQGQPYSEMALNWPAGEWIYYIRNKNEIRRVNVSTGADESVHTEGSGRWFRRFEMTMDGAYAGFQTYGGEGSGDLNGVKAYPFNGGEINHFVGCNAAISASGNFGSSYFAGWHTEISFSRVPGGGMNLWLPLYDKTTEDPDWNTKYPNRGNINGWLLPEEPVYNGSGLRGGMGSECMRWAANSDKWVLQMACYRGLSNDWGSNCVAANWIDKAAFMVSHNPHALVPVPEDVLAPINTTDTIFHGNSTGDMWVDGGPENLGKWEDTLGVWHAVPGFVPTEAARPDLLFHDRRSSRIAGTRAGIQLMLPDGRAFAVRIIDMQGRIILRQYVAGCALICETQLCAGAYQVIADCGKEIYSSRITVTE